MDQHRLDAERVGDEAGVLAAGAAEAVQRIFGDVVAALDRDLLDGVRHVLDGDVEEAVGDLLRRAAVADLCGELGEAGADGLGVERLVAAPARRSCGKCSGMSLPTMTLASVTASGPPRR